MKLTKYIAARLYNILDKLYNILGR